ncbi:hypothetical protein C8R21_1157 [Nitrosospira multiformis]|uniref:Uncharacterized protein n=1 Tax=Nitrosospira multiformis TaxID=1231 RepID=A0A2T5I9L5_9PROT|nr:hypothetical protein C8R21_1157 [Nitrosospira multiformis]
MNFVPMPFVLNSFCKPGTGLRGFEDTVEGGDSYSKAR